MHKSALQGLKRTFMHVSGLPHILIVKLIYKVISFIIKIWWGKTWKMPERAFEGMKRTFMHVSGFPPPYFGNKTKYFFKLVISSKYGGGRPETWINVRFRPWNARLCMFQVFPHHILIVKLIYKVISFIIKIWWGKTWKMPERAFEGKKRTFMHVSGFPPPYFGNKTKYFLN